MSDYYKKREDQFSDDRPLEEVWERLYCDPLENDNRVYSLKIKEKMRYNEKKQENNGFFG